MIGVSLTGRHNKDVTDAVGTITVDGGDVKLKASISDASFVRGPPLNGLTLSLEKPSAFSINYDFPTRDMRFQFLNTVRVMERTLRMMYTHCKGKNQTALDGMLEIDSSNKLCANYGFESRNCKLKYSYTHKGLTTIEPTYDFSTNSWDFALSQKVYANDVVRASYNSSSKILGLDWMRNSDLNGAFKISASVNLAEESRIPTISAESILNFNV